MPEFVRFPLADGGSVLVEMEVEPGLERASAPSGVLRKATTTFEHALGEVRAAAGAALAQFRGLGPDEVELKFGVKLDAQAGAVIARTGLQGQFEVKLKWVREGSTEDGAEEEPPKPAAGGVAGPDPAGSGADPVSPNVP
ncbi:CU044_2847 family protein [Amycolatopsis sp. RTGN1]|uniref:CU044_2847 family protein n=1 Tax=Amycolatopsis ponsaeliensis TaxID=2992142 RepID=UPI002549F7F9|nr:CU044_2847 family protein [Amycolatopsis sp. RTGN1]